MLVLTCLFDSGSPWDFNLAVLFFLLCVCACVRMFCYFFSCYAFACVIFEYSVCFDFDVLNSKSGSEMLLRLLLLWQNLIACYCHESAKFCFIWWWNTAHWSNIHASMRGETLKIIVWLNLKFDQCIKIDRFNCDYDAEKTVFFFFWWQYQISFLTLFVFANQKKRIHFLSASSNFCAQKQFLRNNTFGYWIELVSSKTV